MPWPRTYRAVASWLQQYHACGGRIVQRPLRLSSFGPSAELVGAGATIYAACASGARACGCGSLGDALLLRSRALMSRIMDGPSEFGHIACSILSNYCCMVMDLARAGVYGVLAWRQAAYLGLHPGDGSRGSATLFTRQMSCIDMPTLMPRSLPSYKDVVKYWQEGAGRDVEEGDQQWSQYRVLAPGARSDGQEEAAVSRSDKPLQRITSAEVGAGQMQAIRYGHIERPDGTAGEGGGDDASVESSLPRPPTRPSSLEAGGPTGPDHMPSW